MTVKDFLETVLRQRPDLLSLRDELKRINYEAYEVHGMRIGDKVQSNHQGDLSEIVERLNGMRSEILLRYKDALDNWETANKLIGKEPDGRLRSILKRRYLEGQSWKQICIDMGNIGEATAYRYHNKALDDLAPYWEEMRVNESK